MKDVAFPFFRTMISYIYRIPLPYSVEFVSLKSAQELFDLVNAAKKYLIPQLAQEIVALINKAAISTNTIEVTELVRLAKQYSYLEEASIALLAKCEEEMEDAKDAAKMVKRFSTLNIRFINIAPLLPFAPLLPIIPQVPMLPQPIGDLDIFEDASENEEDVEVEFIDAE